MSHYYQNDPNLKSDFHEIQYTFYNHILDFTSDSGVFSKNRVDYGTNLLLNSLSEDLNEKKILDLGCGYGIIGIAVGKAFPKAIIEMTDVMNEPLN
jgi:16S rRNA (guanine1207-N2)-methyltransferase